MQGSFYRKKKVWFSGFVCLLLSCMLFKDVLVTRIVSIYLPRALTKNGWTVQSITVSNNHLVLQQVSSQNCTLEKVDIGCYLSLAPLIFRPEIAISGMVFSLPNGSFANDNTLGPLGILVGSKSFEPKFKVEQGKIVSDASEATFSFEPGIDDHKIGNLILSEGENEFLKADFSKDGKGISSTFEISRGNLSFLLPWIPEASRDRDLLEGFISGYLRYFVDREKGLESLQANVSLEEIHLENSALQAGMRARSIEGTVSFARQSSLPFWKQVDLFLTFEDLLCLQNQDGSDFGVSGALGEIRLRPKQDPYLKIGGTLTSRGSLIPFELEGSGEILDKGSYWIQSNLSFFLPHCQPQIVASLWIGEEGEGVLEAQCSEIGKEVSYLYEGVSNFFKGPICELERGTVEGNILAKFGKGAVSKIEVSGLRGMNFAFSLPSRQLYFEGGSGSVDASFEGSEITSLKGELRKGKVSLEGMELKEIYAKLEVEDGEFMPSYVEGFYEGMKVAGQVLSASSDSMLHLECGIYAEDLQNGFSPEKKSARAGRSSKEPLFLVFDFYKEGEDAKVIGTASFASGGETPAEVDIQGVIHKKISRKPADLFSRWDLASSEGTFKSEHLTTKILAPFILKQFPSIDLKGNCKLEGSFNETEVKLSLSDIELALGYESFRCTGRFGNKQPVTLNCLRKSSLWDAAVFVDGATVGDQSGGISFEVVDTAFTCNKNGVSAENWKAIFEGVEIFGSLAYDGSSFRVASKSYEGELVALTPLIEKYIPSLPRFKEGGKVSLEQGACSCVGIKNGTDWDIKWTAAIGFSGVSFDPVKECAIEEMEGICRIDSNSAVSLLGVKGIFHAGLFSCDLALNDFHLKGEEKGDFVLIGKEGLKETLALKGTAAKFKDGLRIECTQGSHILGAECSIDPVVLNAGFQVTEMKGAISYKWERVPAYLSLLKQTGLSVPSFNVLNLSGEATIAIAYSPEKSLIQLESPSCRYEGKSIGEVALHLHKIGDLWKLETCKIGPYACRLEAKQSKKGLVFKSPGFSFPGGKAEAQGTYNSETEEIALSSFSALFEKDGVYLEGGGAFTFFLSQGEGLRGAGKFEELKGKFGSFCALAKKGTAFSLTSSEGIRIEKSVWECVNLEEKMPPGKATFETLSYLFSEGQVRIGGAVVKVPKEMVQSKKEFFPSFGSKELSFKGDAVISAGYKKIVAAVSNGVCSLFKVPLELKNIQILQEKDRFYVVCKTLFEKEIAVLQLGSNTDFSSCAVIIKEESDEAGLQIQMEKGKEGKWLIESAEGSFRGLDLKMGRVDPACFSYKTEIGLNLQKLAPLFMERGKNIIEKLRLTDGYRFQGTLSMDPRSFGLTGLKGRVYGTDFGLLGKTFKSFSAKVEFAKDLVSIQEFVLEDDAAFATMKLAEIRRHAQSGDWMLGAPLIRIKDLSPSAFLQGGKEGVLVKNISFYQVKGLLHDFNSFEGKGALNFVSGGKKESSFWDMPLTVIKDFGLDTGLLTPVVGEADFILSRGRCYFTALKNMYSEGERSEFSLASPIADSYLAFDGTWHVDLKMKQNVVWKVTEDFVLSIRGTLDKPKYSFKLRKEDF